MIAPGFRVLAGPSSAPAKLYKGDDIREALRLFHDALPDGPFSLSHSTHVVTGEPSIIARNAEGKIVAALYGVTAGEWQEALRQHSGLIGRWHC